MGQRSWAKGQPLELIELPDPEPRGHELRVRVRSIGVNPVDWKMRSRGPLRLAARLIGPPPPVVFGVDFAGVVDAVGPSVTDFKPGDAVVGGTNFARKQRGSYADTVLVRDDQVARVPQGLDVVTAGALPVAGVTAWMCVNELGHVGKGGKALVLGASGGVGQLVVQFAAYLGGSAVGVCSGKNAALVRSLGASEVIDYKQGDPLVEAKKYGPFSVIADCAGGYSASACRSLLAPGGRHIMVASEDPLSSMNILVPPFSSKLILGEATRARLEPMVAAVASGIQVAISERLPLAEAEKALTMSQAGRMTGKIVLIP